MKTLNEMKQERASKIKTMSELVDRVMAENRAKSDAETKLWNDLDAEVKSLDEKIAMSERQEELNKRIASSTPVENRADVKEPIEKRFMQWLQDANAGKMVGAFKLDELRAQPVLTTTDTGIINKIANPDGISILQAPGEEFLRTLGLKFYTGLNGNLTLSSAPLSNAVWPAEDGSTATTGFAPSSITLAARRVTDYQYVTRETLSQSSPAVYASILQDLNDRLWNAIVYDVFDQLETDAASQVSTHPATEATSDYADMVRLEASIGGLQLNQGTTAYVCSPLTKSYYKTAASIASIAGPAWNGNEMNGYRAFGHPGANADRMYFGDWSHAVVAEFGAPEIIIDPYSKAATGNIALTIVGLYDTGVRNKRAFSWIDDCSTF